MTQPDAPPRSPLRELLALALPTVVTMTSYTVMQSVDKLMVSRIGPDPIYVGAQGNGGLAAFVPISIAMGCLTVINTYVSQNLGAGSPRRAPAYAWTGLWIASLWWLLLLPYAIFLPDLFHAFWYDPANPDPRLAERVALSAAYGQPLLYAAILTMAARGLSQFFYGLHKPAVVLVAGLTGNLTNFFANAVFIYGSSAPETSFPILNALFSTTASIAAALDIPSMGVAGAALGTVIGTAVEFIIPFALFLSPRFNRLYATRSAWKPSLPHLRDILRIGWPGGLMFGNEMICWGLFMVVFVGQFGRDHSTAGWIAHQWMSLSFMPAVGISVAVTAMVGKCMGMGRPDLAARRAWLGLGLACAYMTSMGLLFILFREPMVRLFIDADTPPEDAARIVALGGQFLIATAAFQFFDAIAMTLSGALRGAGDTVWVGVVTVILSWTIIVGGGLALVHLAPQLSSLGPWIAAAAYIILLSFAILARFLRGHWRSIRLITPDTTPTT